MRAVLRDQRPVVPQADNHRNPEVFSISAPNTKRHARACLSNGESPVLEQPFRRSGPDPANPRSDHRACLVSHVAVRLSAVCTRTRLRPRASSAFFGREKGACDGLRRHPLIDPIFGEGPAPIGACQLLSASFAGRNLHLVISELPRDPAAISPLFSWQIGAHSTRCPDFRQDRLELTCVARRRI